MAAGYSANDINQVAEAAYAINAHFKSVVLPEKFNLGDTITVPINFQDYTIANITIYPNEDRDPHISFPNLR